MGFLRRFILGWNEYTVHVNVTSVHVHDAPTPSILSSGFFLRAGLSRQKSTANFDRLTPARGALIDSAIEELTHQAG
jgi:hypothetical protein